jgi:hypothetical protein
VIQKSGLYVVGLADENPFTSVRNAIDTGNLRRILPHGCRRKPEPGYVFEGHGSRPVRRAWHEVAAEIRGLRWSGAALWLTHAGLRLLGLQCLAGRSERDEVLIS